MYKRFADIFKTDNRIFGLDLLRFAAIVLVVLGHSRWMTTTFPKPLRAILHGSGILGVELFFVLSGFLIGGILLKQFEKNNFSLDFNAVKTFWIRRWFRTLPAYYLILMVYVMFYFLERPANLWKYFFFLQNIWNYPPYFFEESWSLCIEEISYLISPLLLSVSVLWFGKNNKGKASYFLNISVLLIVLVTILRIIYSKYFLQLDYKWSYHFREVALIRLDAIYFGFILAYIAQYNYSFWKKMSVPSLIIGLLGIAVLMAFQKKITDDHQSLISNVLFSPMLSIFISLIIPYLSEFKQTKYQFLAKPITGISIISYSLYLINGGLFAESFKYYSNGGANWNFSTALSVYLLFWVLCLGVSAVIFVLFEKPMTDLRNKFK